MTQSRRKRPDLKGFATSPKLYLRLHPRFIAWARIAVSFVAAGDSGQGGTEHENKYSEVGTGSRNAGICVGDDAERPGAVRDADEARETGSVGSTNGWSARHADRL